MCSTILRLCFFLIAPLCVLAQQPDSSTTEPIPTDLLEDFLQNSGAESGDFDLNAHLFTRVGVR